MHAKGFTQDEFALSHPGGALGRRLLTHVRDVMRTGESAPSVGQDATLMDAMLEMSRGPHGNDGDAGRHERVVGIFTDGDLRRTLEKGADLRIHADQRASWRVEPRTIAPERLAAEAVEIMERNKVNQILVVDEAKRLIGALNMHDLFRAKVI